MTFNPLKKQDFIKSLRYYVGSGGMWSGLSKQTMILTEQNTANKINTQNINAENTAKKLLLKYIGWKYKS